LNDTDAAGALLDYTKQINAEYSKSYGEKEWQSNIDGVISSDFFAILYRNLPFMQDINLIQYIDCKTDYIKFLMSDDSFFYGLNLNAIIAKYSDEGTLDVDIRYSGNERGIRRSSDIHLDQLSIYLKKELAKGRVLSDNPFCGENEIYLGLNISRNDYNFTGFLITLHYDADSYINPWHNYSAERGIASYLAFILQLKNKFTDKQVIQYMSGQLDHYIPHCNLGQGKIIRSNIRSNNYYGYTLLREFCENPMREMPTLEKIGTSFRASVKEKNTLLLLEPFADSYDIDTVQSEEFLKVYEMGHDDYYFVEVVKPVESPVAGRDGYAMILDRTETVYGYIPKTQVKPLTDADILQWEITRDTVKSKQGIINDPDGYVNIRKEQNAKSEILGQIKKNEVFHYWELPANWCVVETKTGLRGFIYKDRIKEYRDNGGWIAY
jgi:hypothetical protein